MSLLTATEFAQRFMLLAEIQSNKTPVAGTFVFGGFSHLLRPSSAPVYALDSSFHPPATTYAQSLRRPQLTTRPAPECLIAWEMWQRQEHRDRSALGRHSIQFQIRKIAAICASTLLLSFTLLNIDGGFRLLDSSVHFRNYVMFST